RSAAAGRPLTPAAGGPSRPGRRVAERIIVDPEQWIAPRGQRSRDDGERGSADQYRRERPEPVISLAQSHWTRFSFLGPGTFFEGEVAGWPDIEAAGGAFAAEAEMPGGPTDDAGASGALERAGHAGAADVEGSAVEEGGSAVEEGRSAARVPVP